MLKKRKFYNKQKILTYHASKFSLRSLLKKSLQKNFEITPNIRLANIYQKNNQQAWFLRYKTKAKLRCFYSFSKSVPARNLGLGRFALAQDRLSNYLSNYLK